MFIYVAVSCVLKYYNEYFSSEKHKEVPICEALL